MDNELNNKNLLHLLNQKTRLIAKEVNKRLSDHGLYASQWSVVFCIERFGPITQTEISKYLNVEAPTVTRTLSRLEENGWIIRKQGKDKRERVIELTKVAKQRFTAVEQTINTLEKEMLEHLSIDELEELHILLNKLGPLGENR